MAWSECCASLIHPLPHLDRKKGETQIKSKLTKTQYTWGWKHGITYLRLSFSLETPPLRLNHNSQSHRRFLHLVHGKISQDTYPKRKKLTRIQWPFVIGRLWYYLTKEIFGSKRKWVSMETKPSHEGTGITWTFSNPLSNTRPASCTLWSRPSSWITFMTSFRSRSLLWSPIHVLKIRIGWQTIRISLKEIGLEHSSVKWFT